jgi:hypothetical protein
LKTDFGGLPIAFHLTGGEASLAADELSPQCSETSESETQWDQP